MKAHSLRGVLSIALLFGTTTPLPAARMQADLDDLRKLATLPPMSFTVEVVASRGQLRWKQQFDAAEEITKLQKELRGDSNDALRLLKLGQLFEDAGRTNQAELSYSNAVAAFRGQIQISPKDGQLLSRLGEALANIDQRAEAESVLRRAVVIAPQDPECWLQLGQFLNDNSRSALYPENIPPELINSPALLATKYKPSADQLQRAEKLSQESIKCFDQAISLAPKDASAFEHRACGLSSMVFIRTLKQQITAPDPDRLAQALTVALTPFTPECLPDFRRAAELDWQTPSLVAAVTFAEALSAEMSQVVKNGGAPEPQDRMWDILSADQAKSVQRKINQLEELMKNPLKDKAATAAMFLGLLQLTIMGDELGAELSLRRAVALNPKNPEAWEALMLVFGKQNRYERMVEVGQDLVRAIDSTRSHLLLAKMHEKLNHWDKVLEQVQTAVKAAPDDLIAKLALASTLLRLNQFTQEQLSLLKSGTVDFQQTDPEVRVHFLFICGLGLALDNNSQDARPLFQQALQLQPDHEAAKRALAILDSWK